MRGPVAFTKKGNQQCFSHFAVLRRVYQLKDRNEENYATTAGDYCAVNSRCPSLLDWFKTSYFQAYSNHSNTYGRQQDLGTNLCYH
jgi:hypothetical protein